MSLIAKYEPNYNFRDKLYRTPLHHAAYASNETAVLFLLHTGIKPDPATTIEVDALTVGKWTPLMFAALSGNMNIVNHLLLAGCNPFLIDEQGLTADMIALIHHPYSGIHEYLTSYMDYMRNAAAKSKETNADEDISTLPTADSDI